MGLDTSHDAWHGSYSTFNSWRKTIAQLAGLPPLELMEGFYVPLMSESKLIRVPTLFVGGGERDMYNLKALDERLPIKWESLKPSALHDLLYHSDCDGDIAWEVCNDIADELEKLLPSMEADQFEYWKGKTEQFIDGLRLAYSEKENLDFH